MKKTLIVMSAVARDYDDYDFATFNGTRALNLTAGAKTLTLKAGALFGYRDGKTAVYVITPDRGLGHEFKISEDDFDKRVAPKADEVKLAKAKKLFAAAAKPVPAATKKIQPATIDKTRSRIRGTKVIVSPTGTEPVKKVAAPVAKEQSQDKEEAHLLHLVGNPRQFAAIKTRGDAIAYMRRVWTEVNKLKCDGKLQMPNFRLTKDMGTTFRLRGVWQPRTRTIGASPRLFKATEEIALTTIVHEIAHQCVSEIDKSQDRTQGGHGYEWVMWMRRFGLTASRYSVFDNTNYMTDGEKEHHEKIKSAKETAAKLQTMPKIHYPTDLMAAQWFKAEDNKWHKGLIVCKHDQAGKRWAFTEATYSTSYAIVPSAWFHEVSPEERTELSAKFMENAVRLKASIERNKSIKKDVRATRKAMRSHFGF